MNRNEKTPGKEKKCFWRRERGGAKASNSYQKKSIPHASKTSEGIFAIEEKKRKGSAETRNKGLPNIERREEKRGPRQKKGRLPQRLRCGRKSRGQCPRETRGKIGGRGVRISMARSDIKISRGSEKFTVKIPIRRASKGRTRVLLHFKKRGENQGNRSLPSASLSQGKERKRGKKRVRMIFWQEK